MPRTIVQIRLRAQQSQSRRAHRRACPSAGAARAPPGPLLSLRKRACRLQRSAMPRHRAAERVDLADELSFRAAADRRIARQRADLLRIAGDEQRRHAEARRCERGFDAGMTAADDDRAGVVAHVPYAFVGAGVVRCERRAQRERDHHDSEYDRVRGDDVDDYER